MATVLQDLSDQLATAVAAAGSGVVRVEGRRRMGASGVVWSADGHILTANHVVRRDDNIIVGLADGDAVKASILGRDPSTDLALLKADASGLTPIGHAGADSARVGNLVLALGRPGKTVQATLGIVSALGGSWRTRHGGVVDQYVQTDVVMYPGFSGGPLVDAGGALVGLNSSGLAGGVSLALPLATLARLAETIQTHGRVRRGYLGVSTQQVRLPEAVSESLGQKTGLLLVAVEADSPAAAADLHLGDTIVALGDAAVTNHEDLVAHLTGDRVGTAVPLTIVRGGQTSSVEVTIGERP